jgi:hypothetical protein
VARVKGKPECRWWNVKNSSKLEVAERNKGLNHNRHKTFSMTFHVIKKCFFSRFTECTNFRFSITSARVLAANRVKYMSTHQRCDGRQG